MTPKAFEPLQRAALRVARYLAVARWLGSVVRAYAPLQLILAPLLALASMCLQLGAFLLVGWVLTHVSAEGGLVAATPSILAPVGGPLVIAAVTAALLALAGLAQQGAAVTGLVAYRKLTNGLARTLLDDIEALPSTYDRWRLLKSVDRRQLMKLIAADLNRCGMSTRILLGSITSLLFLLGGLGFFLWIAPLLFLALLAIVALGALIAYPLNLRAVGAARTLEDAQAHRRGVLLSGIDAAIAGRASAEDRTAIAAALAGQSEVVRVVTARLLVVENFRLLLTILLALLVGGIIASVVLGKGASLFNYRELVLLFAAFRFTYQGLQGLLLSLTAVNRFLPSLQRTEQVFSLLARSAGESKLATEVEQSEQTPRKARFAWRIDSANSPVDRGRLEPGRMHLIIERAGASLDILYRILDALQSDRARFASGFVDGRLGEAQLTNAGEPEAGFGTSALTDREREEWIGAVLASVRDAIPAVAHQPLTQSLDRTLKLLRAMDRKRTQGSAILAVDGSDLLWLPDAACALIEDRFLDRIIVVLSDWSESVSRFKGSGWLFVSSGTELAFAARLGQMSEADWHQAQTVYSQQKVLTDAAIDLDDLDI